MVIVKVCCLFPVTTIAAAWGITMIQHLGFIAVPRQGLGNYALPLF